MNQYLIHQQLKKGQAQLIAQAWNRHAADRIRVSHKPRKIRQVLEAEYYKELDGYMHDETFVQTIDLMPVFNEVHANEHNSKNLKAFAKEKPLVTEVYTSAQNVMKEAVRRGHSVGTAMSLETGWDFRLRRHREMAKERVMKEEPFCLVLAFPCGPFSPLQYLIQLDSGRHCVLENPRPSLAWQQPEMRKFIEENDIFGAVFDQCRFGLRGASGKLHRKATQVMSSSSTVVDQLDGVRCKRDHEHEQVIGGSRVTAPAGVYPRTLARAIVVGIEKQFDKEFKPREVLATSTGADGEPVGDEAEVKPEVELSDDEEIDPSEQSMVILAM